MYKRPQLSCPSFGPVTASCFTHCCSPGFPSRFDLLAHSGNQLQDTAFTGFLPSPVRSPLSSQCLLALKSLSQGLLLGNLKLEEKEPKFSPLQGHMEWCEALPLRKEGTGQSKGTEAYNPCSHPYSPGTKTLLFLSHFVRGQDPTSKMPTITFFSSILGS